MSEPLTAMQLRKNIIEAKKGLDAIPAAAATTSTLVTQLRLSVFPTLLSIADKIRDMERELNEMGAAIGEHETVLDSFADDFAPTTPVLEGLLRHLVSVDELIGNVHAMSKAQMEALADAKAKEEIGKALKELMALAEANAKAIADVKALIAKGAEDEDEEGEDDPDVTDEDEDDNEEDDEDDEDDEPEPEDA